MAISLTRMAMSCYARRIMKDRYLSLAETSV